MKAQTLLSLLLIALAPPLTASAQTEPCTFRLTQSTSSYEFWTTSPSEKVFKNSTVPTTSESLVKVYAARNEFEPFLVVANPTSSGSATVMFSGFGSGISTLIYQVRYVPITVATDVWGGTGDYPDPLWPLESGNSVSLVAGENTAFWFTVEVPASTPAGDYNATVTIDGVAIPITLHVFDFVVSATPGIGSQMNFSISTVLSKYGASSTDWGYIDHLKQFFIDYRLTPAAPAWPGGLASGGGAPFIDYNCTLTELSDPYGIWGFEEPAARWLDGTGLTSGTYGQPFNDGAGFSSFMAMRFANNDPSVDQRPSTFCSQTRTASDWYTANNPNSAYNLEWFAYMAEVENYLTGLGLIDKSYHYMANEPQNAADYDAIAWYSRYLKQAAPSLKLMISEEPKPEIYNNLNYVAGGQIDIWLTYMQSYDDDVAETREAMHGEASWLYFLQSVVSPYLNPYTIDHSGMDSRLLGWLFWKYRIRGLQHYDAVNWGANPWTTPGSSGHNGFNFLMYPPSETNTPIAYGSNNDRFLPSIRMELIRDGFEDFEYLSVMNGGAPVAGVANAADAEASKLVNGLTSFNRDAEFLCNLRRLIGELNAGEIAELPDIYPEPTHPRSAGDPGDYYINFQDPLGSPTDNPLIVAGNTYMKIGDSDYNTVDGYGWFTAPNVNWVTTYLVSAPNELQRSILYSDFGVPATFEFDLPAGTYDVTVSVGWQGRTYSDQKIFVEGVPFVDDAGGPDYTVVTHTVDILDSKLTMEMGVPGQFTMLNYMDIEANTASPVTTPTPTQHQLGAAFPNPFGPGTQVTFNLTHTTTATLRVYDVAGRLVRTLTEGFLNAGEHVSLWDGTDATGNRVASGVYFYRLETPGFHATRKVTLIR